MTGRKTMNILNHVKELVDEIYNRCPNWDYPIQVYPDKIIIKDTGQFPCDYIVETMDEHFLVTSEYGNPSVYSPRETIGQVVDFIME